MRATEVKAEIDGNAQSELGDRLLKSVRIICAQVGEPPDGFIDWLTKEGGLNKMVLMYFTKQLAPTNIQADMLLNARRTAPVDWPIDERRFYQRNKTDQHRDEVTVDMINHRRGQIARKRAAQLCELLTEKFTTSEGRQLVAPIPTEAPPTLFQECPLDELEREWTAIIATAKITSPCQDDEGVP